MDQLFSIVGALYVLIMCGTHMVPQVINMWYTAQEMIIDRVAEIDRVKFAALRAKRNREEKPDEAGA